VDTSGRRGTGATHRTSSTGEAAPALKAAVGVTTAAALGGPPASKPPGSSRRTGSMPSRSGSSTSTGLGAARAAAGMPSRLGEDTGQGTDRPGPGRSTTRRQRPTTSPTARSADHPPSGPPATGRGPSRGGAGYPRAPTIGPPRDVLGSPPCRVPRTGSREGLPRLRQRRSSEEPPISFLSPLPFMSPEATPHPSSTGIRCPFLLSHARLRFSFLHYARPPSRVSSGGHGCPGRTAQWAPVLCLPSP